jgi:hypothetical protein
MRGERLKDVKTYKCLNFFNLDFSIYIHPHVFNGGESQSDLVILHFFSMVD